MKTIWMNMEPMDGSRVDEKNCMQAETGDALPLGVCLTRNRVNFSVAAPAGSEVQLCLYRPGDQEPVATYEMEPAVGDIYTLALSGWDGTVLEYTYQVNGETQVDPYAFRLSGREIWGKAPEGMTRPVRGVLNSAPYDWEGDVPLQIPMDEVIAYGIHVRGFTRDPSSRVKHKGTFEGAVEKIPYLTDLGINQIQCMPVYEFDECGTCLNYWGYGDAYFFAPKSAYAAGDDPVRSLKDMVKAFHRAGIEVVLEMPFAEGTSGRVIDECLRYYRITYHIDGFVVNPMRAPLADLKSDPVLSGTKILKHQTDFQTTMRRFLKGDEGQVPSVMYWLRHVSAGEGIFNYIADQSGFTLADLVSYDGKHNEANGEQNRDGEDYNYSWNCGAEGPSRKKDVCQLRKRQVRNAFLLLLFAQGTPYIHAGDEFGNSQKGNNNVYCQDNPTGWVNWRRLEKESDLHAFVRSLIRLRKEQAVFHPAVEMQGMDTTKCGVPDVSYHGESAWQVPDEIASRQLGVYLNGASLAASDCFVAYNMHWLDHAFALPTLPKGKQWVLYATTDEGVLPKPRPLKGARKMDVKARTIAVLVGREMK